VLQHLSDGQRQNTATNNEELSRRLNLVEIRGQS